MNYLDLYSSYPDHTIAAAWDSQVKEVGKAPWLADALKECGNELFARFAAHYAELRALPRGARRALQRRIARSSELAAIIPEHSQRGERRLQHRMAWSVAGAALLLALGQGVATAATISVTTIDPSIVSDGQCSLIEAIVNANNDAATHTDCAAGSGADTIVLPANANVILSAVDNTSLGATGLPVIRTRISIEGNGATIARQASAPAFRLMAVDNSGDLTLNHVTLRGGDPSGSGGGIENFGTLAIENSTISDNTANYGDGGGVSNTFGKVTIKNSTISGNTTNQEGGGVNNYSGTVTIENSTISGNTADVGGGLRNFAYCYFGCLPATLTIENSTISGNRANQGGGISNSYVCYALNCSSDTLDLKNSLVAANQATVATEIENASNGRFNGRSIVTANYFNLFGANGNAGVTGFTPGPTDIVPNVAIANILGPLQNNGGPTETHALVAGSPAIDAGKPGGCRDSSRTLLVTDQRGFDRHVDGNNDGTLRCDIGAFEYGAEFVPVPIVIDASTLATGEAGVFFTSDLMISGGTPPYIVSLIKGKLPAGLSLGNDGIISGTISPTGKGGSISVRITDSVNDSITKSFKINILKALNVLDHAKAGRIGKNFTDTIKIKGGLGPFNWSITSGALPMGLNFNTATGAITGVPTQAGTFPLTVQVTDLLGGVDTANLTLKIR